MRIFKKKVFRPRIGDR
ncbi:BnaC03g58670D [Brassica napus]|uniref:BnaC03g58670D protein n=1 Tax=Brassica napus TaxID=3708 RepID=A0A078HDF7_BRANA|nr:BnaC03g58670D [Brassica napus]